MSYNKEYYEANKDKILDRQKKWYPKNKTSPTRIKMTAEERRMAKNECEARRRDRLRNQTIEQPETIVDPMPKMDRWTEAIKEFFKCREA